MVPLAGNTLIQLETLTSAVQDPPLHPLGLALTVNTVEPPLEGTRGTVVGVTENVQVSGGLTVKFTELLVPPGVVTETVVLPVAALPAMVNVVVICVGVMTVQPLGVMPPFPTLTVQGEAKLVPVKVTGTVALRAPLVGLMDVSVGTGAVTVKGTNWPLCPPEVVTVT